jgi:hypothetical protein
MRRAGHKSFSFFRAPPIDWSENESITQCLPRAHVNQKGKPVKNLITYRTVQSCSTSGAMDDPTRLDSKGQFRNGITKSSVG